MLGGYRFRPWLQVVAKQEDFRRPSISDERWVTATTLGANFDFGGGRTRLVANYVARTSGAARVNQGTFLSQFQVRF